MRKIEVPTDAGPGRLLADVPRSPRAVLLLGHGAGGDADSFDLSALAAGLPPRGIGVVRFQQPWLLAGRKVAGSPKSLDAAWRAALPLVRRRWRKVPLVVGGRSAGARVACRCFAEPALGVVACAFPMHPPGKPEKSRAFEIAGVDAPVLVVQGDKDSFGGPAELAAALRDDPGPRTIVEVAGVGHAMRPGKRGDPEATAAHLVDTVDEFITGLLAR